MNLRMPDDLNRDVPIEHMGIKDCLFVPTLKPDETKTLLRKVASQLEMRISVRTAIVDGYYGVLFQRTA